MAKVALLIGVSEYDSSFKPLPAACRDVEAMKQVLQNSEMGGFDDVQTLINLNQWEMAESIETWFRERLSDDLVLLFFSGHGTKDAKRDLYFAARNTRKVGEELITSTAVSASFVNDKIKRSKSKQQVIILDCCFSGAFGDLVGKDDGAIDFENQLGAEGSVVLTSSSSTQYSFEQKEADLSIYTRYVVEGIQTGAADENNDGLISVDELHQYASRKVQEAAPAMKSRIIVLRDEGFRIQLAKAPIGDPRLRYRKEAERRARAGEFSIPARRLLNSLREELQLTSNAAAEIEVEVLQPSREHQRKLREYEQTLIEVLQTESVLSENTLNDLKDYQRRLGLRDEDVAPIQRKATSSITKEVELSLDINLEIALSPDELLNGVSKQIKIDDRAIDIDTPKNLRAGQRIRVRGAGRLDEHTQQRGDLYLKVVVDPNPQDNVTTDPSDDLSSERGVNYKKLQDLLKAKRWKEADQETRALMVKAVGQEETYWFKKHDKEAIKTFPCSDLRTLDQLWVKYSDGHFGFSVQKQIYDHLNQDETEWSKQVGWQKQGIGWYKPVTAIGRLLTWMSYDDLTFALHAPRGHLPALGEQGYGGDGTVWLLPYLVARLEACSIEMEPKN